MYEIHRLSAEKFVIGQQEVWWFSIPRIGGKYHTGDTIVFTLHNYTVHEKKYMQKPGKFEIELTGRWLDFINRAHKSKAGTEIHFVRPIGEEDNCSMIIGRVEDNGKIPVEIKVRSLDIKNFM